MTAVEFQKVRFAYDNRTILEETDLTVCEGDFMAIIGPNGGGKTTLLKLILGLLTPTEGEVKVFGQTPYMARRLIGYVPQRIEYDRNFPISALEVALTGCLRPERLFPRYSTEDYKAAAKAMKAVSIEDLAGARFGDLSGGQRQRVLIARALAGQPKLLILDEPTAGVDSRVEQDLYELLRAINERVTIVMVSHDLGFISSYVSKVVCLNRRLAVHSPTEITREIMDELYHGPVRMLEHQCML